MKWISTEDKVPEPGQRVLVAYEPFSPGKWWTTVATYIPKFTVPEVDFMCDESWGEGDYDKERDEYFTPEGWYESNVEAETNWKLSPVKFWMPLPEMPHCTEK